MRLRRIQFQDCLKLGFTDLLETKHLWNTWFQSTSVAIEIVLSCLPFRFISQVICCWIQLCSGVWIWTFCFQHLLGEVTGRACCVYSQFGSDALRDHLCDLSKEVFSVVSWCINCNSCIIMVSVCQRVSPIVVVSRTISSFPSIINHSSRKSLVFSIFHTFEWTFRVLVVMLSHYPAMAHKWQWTFAFSFPDIFGF